MSDLSNVKVGDKVEYCGYRHGPDDILTVTRRTKKQIICGDKRFAERMYGAWEEIGKQSPLLSAPEIRGPLTEDEIETVRKRHVIRKFPSQPINWNRLSLPQLQQIKQWLEEAKGTA